MPSINFQLVTPERVVLKKELASLSCPTTLGEITILPHHSPLVATLVPGELHAKTENDDFYLHVAGGFVQVREGNEVVVLADAAEHHYEIDLRRAEESVARARKAMEEQTLSDEEYIKVASSLERSLARMRIQRKHAHRKNPITGEGVFNQ
jgi:F-type H+-transporting ATPase subunit epsilon